MASFNQSKQSGPSIADKYSFSFEGLSVGLTPCVCESQSHCSRPIGVDPEASVSDAVFEQAFIPKRMDEVSVLF